LPDAAAAPLLLPPLMFADAAFCRRCRRFFAFFSPLSLFFALAMPPPPFHITPSRFASRAPLKQRHRRRMPLMLICRFRYALMRAAVAAALMLPPCWRYYTAPPPLSRFSPLRAPFRHALRFCLQRCRFAADAAADCHAFSYVMLRCFAPAPLLLFDTMLMPPRRQRLLLADVFDAAMLLRQMPPGAALARLYATCQRASRKRRVACARGTASSRAACGAQRIYA
jgi:hypothetical protein